MFSALISLAVFGAMPMLYDEPPRLADSPGDGPPPAQGMFEKFDQNGDGVLTPDEFQQAMKQMRKRAGAGRPEGRDGPAARPDEPRRSGPKQGDAAESRPCPSTPDERPAMRRDGSCGRCDARACPEMRGKAERRPDAPMGFGRDDGPPRDRGVDRAVRRALKRHHREIDRMIDRVVREAMRDLHDGPPNAMPPPDRMGAMGPRGGDRQGPMCDRPGRDGRDDRMMKRFDANCDGNVARGEFRGGPGPCHRQDAGRDARPDRQGPLNQPRPEGPRQQHDDPPPSDQDDMEE